MPDASSAASLTHTTLVQNTEPHSGLVRDDSSKSGYWSARCQDGHVNTELLTPLLTGCFALVGGLGGVLLSNHLTTRAEEKRTANEDARRWLADRRLAYAKFLALVLPLYKDISGAMVFLPSAEGDTIPADNAVILSEATSEFYARWDEQLQPALEDVQLLSGQRVAELADRTSWALMEIAGMLDSRQTSDFTFEADKQTRHLMQETRNAMRAELGMKDPVTTYPMPKDWPWLPSKDQAINQPDNDSVS